METLNVKIVNPKASVVLQGLADMELISIERLPALRERLALLRKNEAEIPSFEEITKEVEEVRKERYEREMQVNN